MQRLPQCSLNMRTHPLLIQQHFRRHPRCCRRRQQNQGGRGGGGRTHPLYFTPLLCAVGHTFDAIAWTHTPSALRLAASDSCYKVLSWRRLRRCTSQRLLRSWLCTLSARTQPAYGRDDVIAARLLAVAGSREEPKGSSVSQGLAICDHGRAPSSRIGALPDESGGDAVETSDPIAATAMLRRSLKSWRDGHPLATPLASHAAALTRAVLITDHQQTSVDR